MTKIVSVPGGHSQYIFSVLVRKKRVPRACGHALKSGLIISFTNFVYFGRKSIFSIDNENHWFVLQRKSLDSRECEL
jgi:hypothetical protein